MTKHGGETQEEESTITKTYSLNLLLQNPHEYVSTEYDAMPKGKLSQDLAEFAGIQEITLLFFLVFL